MPLLQNIKRLFEPKTDRLSEQSSHELAPLVNFTVSSQLSLEPPTESGKPHLFSTSEESAPYPGLPARYTLQEVLGEGAFSVVYKAFDNELDRAVAIKIINKSDLSLKQLQNIKNEISIMKKVRHKNILQLLDACELPQYLFLVLEYVSGGEIFKKIIEYTYFLEDLSRHVFVQLVKAIEYLHVRNIVHRDIKPENLLFEQIDYFPRLRAVFEKHMRKLDEGTKVDEGEFRPGIGSGTVGVIKLADFGLAKQLKQESMHKNLKTPCGTVGYTAPEVINCHDKQEKLAKKNYYLKLVDIWLLGCFLYTILCGFPPFYDDNPEKVTMKILQGEFVFLKPWWDEILAEAKDLISRMLVIKPEDRITIDEIWQHPWVTGKPKTEPLGVRALSQSGVQFPEHYFSSSNKHSSVEHIEDAELLLLLLSHVVPVTETDSGSLLPTSMSGSNSQLLLNMTNVNGMLSPRAEAIKMVFNNPVIHTKQVPKNPVVRFTDEAFKLEFVLLLLDDEEFSKIDNPPSLTFKNVFSGLGETIVENNEEDDDVQSLSKAVGRVFVLPDHNDSLELLNLAEFDRETRLLSIILGIGGDFKFTLNLNNLLLIGRRKLQKGSLALNCLLGHSLVAAALIEDSMLAGHGAAA